MAVTLAKSEDEIRQLPLVELALEILKVGKEPTYFRDLMKEIQTLRGMSDDEVMHIIARLYTDMNIDGRFVCIGQNIWGLKRWYPADKTAEKAISGKRFIRKSDDAFSDDDEDDDDDFGTITDDEDADDILAEAGADTVDTESADDDVDGEDSDDDEDFDDDDLSEDGDEDESSDDEDGEDD